MRTGQERRDFSLKVAARVQQVPRTYVRLQKAVMPNPPRKELSSAEADNGGQCSDSRRLASVVLRTSATIAALALALAEVETHEARGGGVEGLGAAVDDRRGAVAVVGFADENDVGRAAAPGREIARNLRRENHVVSGEIPLKGEGEMNLA